MYFPLAVSETGFVIVSALLSQEMFSAVTSASPIHISKHYDSDHNSNADNNILDENISIMTRFCSLATHKVLLITRVVSYNDLTVKYYQNRWWSDLVTHICTYGIH